MSVELRISPICKIVEFPIPTDYPYSIVHFFFISFILAMVFLFLQNYNCTMINDVTIRFVHLSTLFSNRRMQNGGGTQRVGLYPIEPIAPNWAPCLRCRRLELSIRSCYKYIQQHIAGHTENNWAPHLLRVALGIDIFFNYLP